MSSSPHFTGHKLASYLVALALALSFVIPAYAQETTEDETAVVTDAVMEEATQDATGDLETAQQRSGCQGILTVDGPAGDVRGSGWVWGWLADLADPFNPGGPIDIYRGDTFIATTATGASRDEGEVRADVDRALGLTDGRTGWRIRMDWSTQPAGSQTYRVLGRTSCEWLEGRFTVNVNPTPPAPAASLSINDESRTLSSNTNTGIGVGTTCIQYNVSGQCTQVSSVNTGTGSVCISRDSLGNCIQFSSVGTTSTLSDVNFEFIVTLNPASTQQVQVDYATRDGSGVNGTDYTSTTGTLTFAAGETTKTITVRVYNRGQVSASDRDFFVALTNPRGASISDGEGRGIIRRNFSSVSGCTQFDVNGNCISYSGTGVGTGVGTFGNCPAGYFWNGVQCTFTGTGSGFGGTFTIQNLNAGSCPEGPNCTFRVTQSGGSGTVNVTWTATGASGGTSPTCSASATADYAPNTGTIAVNANSFADILIAICVDADIGAESFTVTIVPSSGSATIPAVSVTIP